MVPTTLPRSWPKASNSATPVIAPNLRTRVSKQALEPEAHACQMINRLPTNRERRRCAPDRQTGPRGLKEEFGGHRFLVRGPVEVMAYLMFAICVLSVYRLICLLH